MAILPLVTHQSHLVRCVKGKAGLYMVFLFFPYFPHINTVIKVIHPEDKDTERVGLLTVLWARSASRETCSQALHQLAWRGLMKFPFWSDKV